MANQIKWLKNIEPEIFMLDQAIRDALIPLEPIAAAKNITLAVMPGNSTPFYGDRKRIIQLIVILVDNAINYTGNGGRVKVCLITDKQQIKLQVSDNGYGIETEHLPKVFDRFYRITKTRSLNKVNRGREAHLRHLFSEITLFIVQNDNL